MLVLSELTILNGMLLVCSSNGLPPVAMLCVYEAALDLSIRLVCLC